MKSILQLSISLSIIFNLLSCTPDKERIPDTYFDPVAGLYDSTLMPFYHGVASGDPLPDRVVIWTRVTPKEISETIKVKWEIAEDPNFNSIYKSDTLSTSIKKDYTVKVDVDALEPDRVYYYRFNALGKNSITGRTKTTPVSQIDSLQFAVVSCSNWEWGYFNAYDKIADRSVLDAVIHLGDYIYEYAVGKYGDTTIGRFNLPAHEIVTLQDYRTRYSQYHTDKGLRRARQQHPFITIWDDHEVANNSYVSGAQNHQPEEGEYETRKKAARQAYYEWIPIRENRDLYRSISFGSLADLIMLDERLAGRSKPADSLTAPDYNDENRSMLGDAQLQWFENELSNSKATWRLIGNQVIFSDMLLSEVIPSMPRNLDAWDGYPVEKASIKNHIESKRIQNIVFLTGDTHASWAIEVATDIYNTYDPATSRGAFAVEFGTPSISAANSNERKSDSEVMESEKKLLQYNPHVKYTNNRDHGYVLLTLNNESATGQWYYVETLRKEGSEEYLGKEFSVQKGSNTIKSISSDF
ncbi:MAG: alkaline phosphatase D family protein [Cyclobacteriaceae bacterium]